MGKKDIEESIKLIQEKHEEEDNNNLRKRWRPEKDDPTWQSDLPYGGKVFLARRKKPDPWWLIALEVLGLLTALGLGAYTYYWFDHAHFHVSKVYAHLGYPHAQHIVGQRLLHGKGAEQNDDEAVKWLKKAADQKHPHASYNLAIAHMKGIRVGLQPGLAKNNRVVGTNGLLKRLFRQLPSAFITSTFQKNLKPFRIVELYREAHRLIHHAAKNGVAEALDTLNDVCINGGCEA